MEKLKILHMYPNMLDLYGDSGNVEVLSYRCKMRGIELEVSKHLIGDKETDFTQYDIIYLGGGADFEHACPFGAIFEISQVFDVLHRIRKGEQVVAIVALNSTQFSVVSYLISFMLFQHLTNIALFFF